MHQLKRYFWLIHLCLITLLAAGSAELFLTYLESMLQQNPEPLATPLRTETMAVERHAFPYYAIIEKRNIFNSTPEPVRPVKPPPTRTPPPQRPPTTLNLKLLGTVVGGDARSSYAVIEDVAARKQDIYQLGDTIHEAILIEIDRNRVVLKNGNREEVLYSFQEEEEKKRRTPQRPMRPFRQGGRQTTQVEGVRQIDETTWRVSRESLTEQLENFNRLLTEVRMVPNFSDGKPDGFRIANIRPNSFLRALGLRRGDVLKGVNGLKINSPEDAFRAYQQFQTESTITVDIERNNTPQTLTFEIR